MSPAGRVTPGHAAKATASFYATWYKISTKKGHERRSRDDVAFHRHRKSIPGAPCDLVAHNACHDREEAGIAGCRTWRRPENIVRTVGVFDPVPTEPAACT
jgi:hypothetical protein